VHECAMIVRDYMASSLISYTECQKKTIAYGIVFFNQFYAWSHIFLINE
jgi:hypothetical protein